jgi:hypothetical protein
VRERVVQVMREDDRRAVGDLELHRDDRRDSLVHQRRSDAAVRVVLR